MDLAEYRQHCHDIIDTHRPVRTWRTLWLLRTCGECGNPWTELDNVVGCWLVRGAVAELAAMPELRRPAAHRRHGCVLAEDTTMPLDRWRQR